MTIKFPAGNKIIFGQDFGWYRGIPDGLEWEVEYATAHGLTLSAQGYGAKGNYGCGKIYVYLIEDEPKPATKTTKPKRIRAPKKKLAND